MYTGIKELCALSPVSPVAYPKRPHARYCPTWKKEGSPCCSSAAAAFREVAPNRQASNAGRPNNILPPLRATSQHSRSCAASCRFSAAAACGAVVLRGARSRVVVSCRGTCSTASCLPCSTGAGRLLDVVSSRLCPPDVVETKLQAYISASGSRSPSKDPTAMIQHMHKD